MSTGIILHCMPAEKFIEPFIDFVEQNFDLSQHQYLIRQSERFKTKHRSNVVFVEEGLSKLKQVLLYVKHLNRAEKIILHGLFDRGILLILFMQPWLLKKCYWVMWGGDLYYCQNRPRAFRSDTFERIRASVISRIGHFVSCIKGDYELAKKWYGVRGQYHECLMYPSNLYKEYATPPKKGDVTNILIGNSADSTNNHLESFEKLLPFKNENILIYCPLSYGSTAYAERITKLGKEMFGDKFIPLLKFMPFEKYLELLGKIDIAVFAHKRQQAMGNTITLLGLGKKVYMRSDVTTWSLFTKLGVNVFDVEKLNIRLLSDDEARRNNEIISEHFSEQKLVEQLASVFK